MGESFFVRMLQLVRKLVLKNQELNSDKLVLVNTVADLTARLARATAQIAELNGMVGIDPLTGLLNRNIEKEIKTVYKS